MAPKRKAKEVEMPEEESQTDWASLKVTQLKSELTARGISITGKKVDLVARLESDDSNRSSALVQPATEAQAGEDVAWGSLAVPKLKEELKARGLAYSGKRADLIGRLEAHDIGLDVGTAPAPKSAKQANAASTATGSVVPHASASTATLALKAKPKKKPAPKDLEIEGPLAADVLVHKYINHETGERRQREFVPAPDDKFKATYWRITNERMFMLDRQMTQDRKGHACQTFDIAGSTGNIYNVTIGRSPNCDCMDARFRGQKCKHINYALIAILKAPIYLQYQLAFLSDELESIFTNAPVTSAPEPEHVHDDSESVNDGTRKPIEGDCPICVFPMESEEELVWCKAACGQNFHKECFEQWKRSKHGGRVTCVYCRSEWQEPSPKKGTLASLVGTAPIVGSYRNIGHHPMYLSDGKKHDGEDDGEEVNAAGLEENDIEPVMNQARAPFAAL